MKNLLSTGEITGTHGLDGCLRISPFSGEIKHLLQLKKALVSDGRQKKILDVASMRSAGSDVLVSFKGIEGVEEARKYIKWTVWVPRRRAATRRRNEFYVADLTGCSLIADRRVVGTVKGIYDSGPRTYLEIDRADGDVAVLPFIDQYFGKVNIRKRSIEIRTPWLLG